MLVGKRHHNRSFLDLKVDWSFVTIFSQFSFFDPPTYYGEGPQEKRENKSPVVLSPNLGWTVKAFSLAKSNTFIPFLNNLVFSLIINGQDV